MGQVHIGHDEAARADGGAEALRGAAVDGGVLADDRAGADLHPGLLALELEVLGVAAEDRAVAHAHVFGENDVLDQPRPRTKSAAVADGDLRSHHHPRADHDAGAKPDRRIDDGRGVNLAAHRSTTRAIISASATTFPST